MAILLKFIALPLYPVGMITVLMLISLLGILLKKEKVGIIFGCLGFIVLLLFSSPVVANFLAFNLEKQYSQNNPPPGTCSAIVLLAGGERSDSYSKYPEINEAGDRILNAARLYKKGFAPKIICTGGDVGLSLKKSMSGAETMARLLKDMCVDSTSILIENKTRNTHEHASNVAKILDSLKMNKKIVLVTSASHMKRAVAVFKKYGGYTIYTAPTDYQTTGRLYNVITDFFPNSSSLNLSTMMLHEYYGLVGYKMLGWI